jgi:hypothetical protein
MASLDFVASAAVARNPSGNRTSVAKPRWAECQGLCSGETIPILVSPISAKSAFHHRNRSKGVAQRNHNVIATWRTTTDHSRSSYRGRSEQTGFTSGAPLS